MADESSDSAEDEEEVFEDVDAGVEPDEEEEV
jgi:hypothetical protein